MPVKVTNDAGLLPYREIDDVFGLTDMAACKLTDNRSEKIRSIAWSLCCGSQFIVSLSNAVYKYLRDVVCILGLDFRLRGN